jgi:membrane protease YdiL (CAAX protease family)
MWHPARLVALFKQALCLLATLRKTVQPPPVLLTRVICSCDDHLVRGFFSNEIVLEQIAARQPGIPLWICLWAIPTWGPKGLTYVLMHWSVFAQFAGRHFDSYLLGYFVFQGVLIGSAVIFLSSRYSSALWKPRPKSWNSSLKSVIILMPLLIYYLGDYFKLWKTLQTARSLQTMGQRDFHQMVVSLYEQMWRPLGGYSPTQVICYSTLSFISPVLEEMLFSGLLTNGFAKRFNIPAAFFCTPFCFMTIHSLVYGVGPQLVPLFFASLTYTLVRLYSGNLVTSVLAHWAANFVVLFPKWIIAAMYFGHS